MHTLCLSLTNINEYVFYSLHNAYNIKVYSYKFVFSNILYIKVYLKKVMVYHKIESMRTLIDFLILNHFLEYNYKIVTYSKIKCSAFFSGFGRNPILYGVRGDYIYYSILYIRIYSYKLLYFLI